MTQFTKKIRLTNGLTVIFEKNENAKIVSINIGIKVGAVNEKNHESGLCHLIEHMVFKGTRSFAAGEIATLVESHGGELNAYTSLDQTVYYINIPSKSLALGLKLLKEMVFDAIFDPVELKREKEVIIEEIKRGQDSPHRVLGESVFHSCYQKHPYGRPVIGTEKLVRGFSRNKIIEFYKKYYCPQNMILAVCGHIHEADISKEIEKQFRFTDSPPLCDTMIPQEPSKKTFKIIKKTMNIKATYFDLAFEAPSLTHPDVPALDILSHLLGESETSLLEHNTKDQQQLVHSIYSSCYTPKYPGLFLIGALINPALINKALRSIKKEVAVFQNHLIENEKIERAKLLARAQLIYEQQTCEGTARKWITYETTAGDYKFDDKYMDAINKITASDIQKVANKYLNFNKVTLVILHPNKTSIQIDSSIFKKDSSQNKKRFRKISQKKEACVYLLDNGIRVVLKENHRLPIVSIKTASLGGLRYENRANNGINQLLSNVITRGTTNLTPLALAEKIEWLAASLNSYTGRNSFGFSFSFLSEKTHHAIPLLSDVILNPAFNDQEVEKEKKSQLEAIKNYEDNPSSVVFRQVLQEIFKGHPYQYHTLGTSQSVKSLGPLELRKYYNQILTPKNLVIAVVGDFESEYMLELLNNAFHKLKNRPFPTRKIQKPRSLNKMISTFKKKDNQQAHIALGFLGASLYSKDKHVLEIINNILSGQGGRLFLSLRDKMSLAYSVGSTYVEGLETGFFGTYIGTEPGKIEKSISSMLNELRKIQNESISSDELSRAKNYIIGNHEIDHQKNSSIALQLALNLIYGKHLGDYYDFQKHISKVSRQDVQRVAKKYLNLDRYVLGIVGPVKK